LIHQDIHAALIAKSRFPKGGQGFELRAETIETNRACLCKVAKAKVAGQAQ